MYFSGRQPLKLKEKINLDFFVIFVLSYLKCLKTKVEQNKNVLPNLVRGEKGFKVGPLPPRQQGRGPT